ncbi:MAG: DNA polymerase III subunit delta [Clostridia bacterium]|nr:DNA polymerase III subunit delta [Clostridia bacterium]
MATTGEQMLKEKIRTSPLGAYLIYGDEDYLKKIYVNKIVSAVVDDDFAEFNYHKFNGKEVSLGDVYDSVEAMPMMSDTTCVLVEDMPFDTLDESGIVMLNDMVVNIPETCALIFYTSLAELPSKNRDSVKKLFEEYGTLAKLEKRESGDIVRTVENAAKKRGVPFENGAAKYLLECVGGDLNTIHNEMEKLCAYALGRTVTKADVDTVCSKTLEAKAFDIMRCLHSGRFETAMSKLETLISQKEEPVMLLGAFITSYMDIYRARAAVVSGFDATQPSKYYDYKRKEFRLNNASRDSRGLSLPAIYECIEILAKADDLLKSYETDKALVLEQTLTKLAAAESDGRR